MWLAFSAIVGQGSDPMDATPPLEPGLTLLAQPDRGALHRLVLDSDWEGTALWVDAGGAASTYGLTARVPTRRALQGIRVARAFTAHQHHQLVRNAVAAADGRTGLVVAPHLGALYDAADAPASVLDRLFSAAVDMLAELADALAIPVLATAPGAGGERRATITERADREIDCEATDLGYAYATEGFRTTAYWGAGWWQTTIPYWVELCGAGAPVGAALAAEPDAHIAPGPEPAHPVDAGQADLGGW